MSGAVERVADLVRDRVGMVIAAPQLPALEAAMRRAAPELDPERFLAEAHGRLSGPPLLSRLVDEVTIKETYFFRAPRELQAIDWRGLVDANGSVRVWVAACATGEEAYTLAMLASQTLGTMAPPVSILASDVSGGALERAAAARYSDRAVRHVPAALRERYFSSDERGHAVRDNLKALVQLRQHNLIADVAPPAGEVPFDVIVCRNVLIYFDADTVEQVVRSLEGALRAPGQLILGAADRLSGVATRLGSRTESEPALERRRPRPRQLRRPLGVEQTAPRRRSEDRVEEALWAADDGDLEQAVALTELVLSQDPLNADAHFARGLAELGLGDATAAVLSLRRALYVDPSFGLAAFQLGRAHDSRGDERAAVRAFEQALRTLDPNDDRHRVILDQVDLGDIAAACRARLSRSLAR